MVFVQDESEKAHSTYTDISQWPGIQYIYAQVLFFVQWIGQVVAARAMLKTANYIIITSLSHSMRKKRK